MHAFVASVTYFTVYFSSSLILFLFFFVLHELVIDMTFVHV